MKYLNDASFAVQWARNLAVNKLWGNRKISASLQEKGIQVPLINDAVASARQELTEEAAIKILVGKKAARKKATLLDAKEKQRIFQSLMGRGFPPGLILNQLGKRAEEDINDDDR